MHLLRHPTALPFWAPVHDPKVHLLQYLLPCGRSLSATTDAGMSPATKLAAAAFYVRFETGVFKHPLSPAGGSTPSMSRRRADGLGSV